MLPTRDGRRRWMMNMIRAKAMMMAAAPATEMAMSAVLPKLAPEDEADGDRVGDKMRSDCEGRRAPPLLSPLGWNVILEFADMEDDGSELIGVSLPSGGVVKVDTMSEGVSDGDKVVGDESDDGPIVVIADGLMFLLAGGIEVVLPAVESTDGTGVGCTEIVTVDTFCDGRGSCRATRGISSCVSAMVGGALTDSRNNARDNWIKRMV